MFTAIANYMRKRNQPIVLHPGIVLNITIGTEPRTGHEIKRSLQSIGFKFLNSNVDILNRQCFTVAASEHRIQLLVTSIKELGFDFSVNHEEVVEYARARGWCLCPAETAVRLLLQYGTRLAFPEYLIPIMQPIKDPFIRGSGDLFRLSHFPPHSMMIGEVDAIEKIYEEDLLLFLLPPND